MAKIAESIGIPSSYAPEKEGGADKVRRNMDKAQRFFGQAPPTAITREPIREPVREPEETPWFLKMTHEGEVFYDNKGDLPILKCGTLAGLVEHLTRHDKLDASFNNTFLALPRLDFQTSVVHVVYIASTLEVTENVILEFADGLQKIRHILVLLDIPNDFCSLSPLIEVDQF